MAWFNWRRWLRGAAGATRAAGTQAKRRKYRKDGPHRLAVEQLEARLAPATFVWDGGGADNLWSNGFNWAGDIAPSPTALDDLVFPRGAAGLTNSNDFIDAVFNSITFSGSGYILGGAPLTLGDPSVSGSGNLIVSDGFTGAAVAMDVTLAGPSGSRQFVNVGFGADVTISGRLSGNTGSELTKFGAGTLVLTNDNSDFTGPIALDPSAGIVRITHANALGQSGLLTNGTTVGTNTTLQLQNVAGSINETLILNGPGIISNGALLSIAGDNTWAGPIILDSDSTIGATAGFLTIQGQISDLGAGHNLIKEGPAPITFVGSNTYRGLTTVNDGILRIQNALALGLGGTAQSGTLVNRSITKTGTLQIDDPSGGFTVFNEHLTLNGPGVGNLGALANVRGDNTWAGPVTLGSPLPNGSSVFIGVASTGTLTISGVTGDVVPPSGPFNITKVDSGKLIFNNANTYRGFTTVAGGILNIRDSQGLGPPGTGGSTQVNAGAALELEVDTGFDAHGRNLALDSITGLNGNGPQLGLTINEPLTIFGTGVGNTGALHSITGINQWTADIVLPVSIPNPVAAIGVDPDANASSDNNYLTNDYSLTVSGVIRGPIVAVTTASGIATTLSKVGGGHLIPTATNTYFGHTSIDQGWVTIRSNTALGGYIPGRGDGAQPTTTVQAGAALHIKPPTGVGSLSFARNLVLGGIGVVHRFSFISEKGALMSLGGVNTVGLLPLAANNVHLSTIKLNGNAGIGVESLLNEAQTVTISGATTGTFTLTFNGQTTSALSATATAAEVQAALNGLSSIGGVGGSVTVTLAGGVYTVTFNGTLSLVNLPPMTATGAGGTNAVVATIQDGGGPSDLTIVSSITDAPNTVGGLTKFGSRRLILQGDGAYSGGVDIREGVLRAQNDTALGQASSGTFSNDQVYSTTATTVQVGAALELQGGVASLNGGLAAGSQTWNERLVLNGAGQQVAVAGNAGTFRLTFNGQTTAALPFNITAAQMQTALTALSSIGGVGGSVTVSRTGNVSTVVFTGSLAGANPLMTAATSGGNVAVTVTGANAPLLNLSDDNMWRGPVSLNASTIVDVAANSRLSLFGAIDDLANPAPSGSALTKIQAGELVLGGASSYRGVTHVGLATALGDRATVPGGILTIENSQALGGITGGTVIADGSQLQIQGSITVAGEPLTIQGSGVGPGAVPTNLPLRWFNTGPGPINNGQTNNALPVSGRVTGVAVDPTDVNVMYIATAGGGAWKTRDGGRTWVQIFDASPMQMLSLPGNTGQFTLTFNGATTAPLNLSSPTLAADIARALNALPTIGGLAVPGSVTVTQSPADFLIHFIRFGGALSNNPVPLITGAGIGASNPVIINLPVTLSTGAIAVDPNDPRIIYLGTGEANSTIDSYYGSGVYVSTDSGQTWTMLTDTDGKNPLFGLAVSKIVIDPGEPVINPNGPLALPRSWVIPQPAPLVPPNPPTGRIFVATTDLVASRPVDATLEPGVYRFDTSTTQVQTLTVPRLGTGSFTLTFRGATTALINLSSGNLATAIQTALNALPTIGGLNPSGFVTVTRSTINPLMFSIAFQGGLLGMNPTLLPAASVATIAVLTGGNGYASPPRVIIDPPDLPGGRQAIALARIAGGQVVGITVIYGGSGYLSRPNVLLVGGGGTGATAAAAVISPILMTATGIGVPNPIVTPSSTWVNLTATVTVPRISLSGQTGLPPDPNRPPGPNDDFRINFLQSNVTWSDLSFAYIDISNPPILDIFGLPGAGPLTPVLYASLGTAGGSVNNAVFRTEVPNQAPVSSSATTWFVGDPGVPQNEVQRITITPWQTPLLRFQLCFRDPPPPGGPQCTPPTPGLPNNATAAEIQAALNALPTIGGIGGVVTVSFNAALSTVNDHVFDVTFGGTLSNADMPEMTSIVQPTLTVTISTVQNGSGIDTRSGGAFPAGAFNGNIKFTQWVSGNPGLPIDPFLVPIYSQVTLYAAVTFPENPFAFPATHGQLREIFRSNDGGKNWAAATGNLPNYMGVNSPETPPIQTAMGWSASTILATSATTVFVGGQQNSPISHQGHLFETVDGGANWLDISRGENPPHSGAHALGMLGATGSVVVGTDGGVWRLDDPTPPTFSWSDINGNLKISQFNGIAVHPNDPNFALGGTQGNGVVRFDDSQAWRRTGVADGEGGRVQIDPKNPSIAYAANIINGNGIPLQIPPPPPRNGVLDKSIDGGRTWTTLTLDTWGAAYFPFLVDAVNTNRLLAGGNRQTFPFIINNALDESLNGGASWVSLNVPLRSVTAIAAATFQGDFQLDPDFRLVADKGTNTYDPDTIYVFGVDPIGRNVLFVTKNHGQSWQNRTTGLPVTGLPPPATVVDVAVDAGNRDIVYVLVRPLLSGRNRVFRSTDAGQNWSDITDDLPNMPLWKIVVDPRHDPGVPGTPIYGDIYVGTDDGVWRLRTGQTTWQRFGAGLPRVQVKDLELNQTLNTLTAGTYGRSMFQFFLDEDPKPTTFGALRAVSGSSQWTGPVRLIGDPVNNTVAIGAAGSQALQNGIATAQLNIVGPISDFTPGSNPRLHKVGRGDVILSGDNTYGGVTEIKEGALVVHNPRALGSALASTIVNTGTALELETDLQREPVELNGDGIRPPFNGHNTGALRNLSSHNTYTGVLTLRSNSTIGVDSGSSLTIGARAGLAGTGTITDGGSGRNLVKELTGALIFASSNSYGGGAFQLTGPVGVPTTAFPGGTVVAQGALNVQHQGGLGVNGNTTTVLNGAQLQLQGGITVANQTARLSGTGIVNRGALENISGANVWQGPVTLAQDAGFNPRKLAPATVSIGAQLGDSGDKLTINGKIDDGTGALGLNKVGPGTVVLNNNNSYDGVTTVETGVLRIQQSGALGSVVGIPGPPGVNIVPSNNDGQGYAGLDFSQSGGLTPPDTNGAAGPFSYVETVNATVAIYRPKATGATAVIQSLSTFFAGLPISHGFYFDPAVIYHDNLPGLRPDQGRFVVLSEDANIFAGLSVLDIAVSKTSNPTTLTSADWFFYQIVTSDPGGVFADYPGNVGYNRDALVVTFNMFDFSFRRSQIVSININDLINGNPLVLGTNYFRTNDPRGSLRPATMHDAAAGDPMWLVTEGPGDTLGVIRMSNVLSSTPTLTTTNVAVPPYSRVVPPRNPDGSAITFNIDSRIQKAATRNNLLVATHPVAVSATQDVARWYAFDIGGGLPVLQDRGDVSAGNNTYLYYPAIDINAAGHIGMTFMRSGTASPTDFPSMWITGRTPADAPGTMLPPVLVPAGAGQTNLRGGRAGDLGGINVDPVDDSFWASNEFANTLPGFANWGTAIANFTLGPTAPPPNGTVVRAGATLQLDGDPTNVGAQITVGEQLTLGGGGIASTGALRNVSGNNVWTGPVTLQTNSAIGADTNTQLTISGNVQNPAPAPVPAAGLTKVGPGTLVFPDANTYTGKTFVSAGVLNIRHPGALGNGGPEMQTLSVFGPNGSFTLTFNGQTTGALNILSPTLRLDIQTALNALPSIGGVGGSVTVTQGAPPFSNVYTVTFGGSLSILNLPQLIRTASGGATVVVNTIQDGPEGTVVNSGGTLQLQGGLVFSSELLTLNGNGAGGRGALESLSGNNTWNTPITLGSNAAIGAAADTLVINQPIGGGDPGITKVGPGTLEYRAKNTYTGLTQVNHGTLLLNNSAGNSLNGNLTVGDNVGGAATAVARWSSGNQIPDTATVIVNADGLADLNNRGETSGLMRIVEGSATIGNIAGVWEVSALEMTAGSLTTGAGSLRLAGNVTATSSPAGSALIASAGLVSWESTRTFTVNDGPNASDLRIAARLAGLGDLIKTGSGLLELDADSSAFWSGTAVVNAGVLQVDGVIGPVSLNGGTLGGDGTVGAVTATSAGGTVNPGASPGILRAASAVWNSQTRFFVEASNTTPGTGHDQLQVNGTINLGNASLDGAIGGLVIGDTITILRSTGLSGRFAQGSAAFIGGQKVAITYTATDVVLRRVRNSAIVTLTSSVNPSVFGEPVVFSVIVAPEPGISLVPTGTVTFTIDGVSTPRTLDAQGRASLSTSSPLSVGLHNVSVVYNGDANFENTTGSPQSLTQIVNKASTFTTLTSSSDPSVFGQAVTITATVSALSPGSGTPQGQLTFTLDGTPHAPVTVNAAGEAFFSLPPLNVGPHAIIAEYAGNVSYRTSSSTVFVQDVDKANTNLTGSSSPRPSVFGQTVTLSVIVAAAVPGGGTPTGTVTFVEGTTPRGSSGINAGGVASITVSSFTARSHTINANYTGDGNFNAGTTTISHAVNKANTDITISSSGSPTVFGQPVSFTASVSAAAPGAGTPAGTVTFTIDGLSPQNIPLDGMGKAVYTTTTISSGSHTVSAGYDGNSNFNMSGPANITHVVNAVNTTTTLTTTNANAVYGEAVIRATVVAASPSTEIPTGTVTFSVNNGTTTTPFNITLAAGVATLTPTLPVGSYTISASYAGTANFNASSAGPMSQVVNKANAVIFVSSSPAPSVFGQIVTFTASVETRAPGSALPTGTVDFIIDGVTRASNRTLDSAGRATFSTAALGVGVHFVQISYSGDARLNAGVSANHTQTVNRADSQVAITSSASPAVFGQAVTFTAAVSAVAPGAGTPSGNVSFVIDDVTQVPNAPLDAAGKATLIVSTLRVGSHTIRATYNADTNFNGSPSPDFAQTVNKAAAAFTISSAPNPSVFGQTVNFTVTVAAAAPGAGTPSGTVTFAIDGAPQPPLNLVGGVAAFSTSTLSVGNRTINVSYSGDGNFNSGTSANHTHTVNKAGASVAVSSSLNPSVIGQSVTFTATVSAVAPGAGTPSGNVTFVISGVPQAPDVALVNGKATFTTGTLGVGTHSVAVNYLGDTRFDISTGSLAGDQTVNKANVGVVVSAAPTPSAYGQAVTFTATVSALNPALGTPTGTVVFRFDGGLLQSPPQTLNAGVASFTISSLDAGTHVVEVNYSGNATFNGGSGTLNPNHAVNKANTRTTVATSKANAVYGEAVIMATVVTLAPAVGTPNGTVTFTLNNGTTTATVNAALNSQGVATLFPTPDVGVYIISASYNGTPNFNGSASANLNQTVTKANSAIALTASVSPSVFGQAVSFTATVSAVAPGSGTPAGNVTFTVDGTPQTPAIDLASGKAVFTISTLGVGAHTVVAAYNGSNNFNTSTTGSVGHNVAKANAQVAVTSSLNPSVFGQAVTLTAMVAAAAPGAGTPTGTVTFLVNGAPQTPSAGLVDGKATFTISSLQVGVNTINAVYSGSGDFHASTSPGFAQTVNKAGTITVVSSSAEPSVFGQTVSLTAAVSAVAPGSGTPIGNVTFVINGTPQTPNVNLDASGKAVLPISTLGVGIHSVVATYNGAGNFDGSSSPTFSQTVNQGNTTVAMSASVSPSVFGQSVTFTATVAAASPAAGTPGGTVTFLVDGVAQTPNSNLDASGRATFSISSLGGGGHTVTANYNGSASFNTSSGATSHTVDKANTNATLSSSLSATVFGQAVTFTATIAAAAAAGAGTPTGSVTFQIDGVNQTPASLSAGKATLTTSTVIPGPHVLQAFYAGSNDFNASTSSTLAHTVTASSTTTNVTTSNANTVYGAAVIRATVAPVSPGGGVPTGTVVFRVNNGVTTTDVNATLNASGVATLTPPLDVGTYTISAAYNGTVSHNGSSSSSITQIITKASTTTTVASSKPNAVFGEAIITVTVAPVAPSTATPTGPVTFAVNNGVSTTFVTATLNAGGVATLPDTLNVGTYTITATYDSTLNFNGSASSPLNQTITRGSTSVTVTASANPSVAGQVVTFTATVTAAAPGGGTPAGTVTFLVDGVAQGVFALSAGKATFSTSSLTVGQRAITASYGGSTNHQGSSSSTLTQNVNEFPPLQTFQGGDGQVFGLDSQGNLWRYRVSDNSWTSAGFGGLQIAVSNHGDGVVANDIVFLRGTDSKIWFWTGTFWSFTGGYLPHIIAGDNQVFGVGFDGQIWQFHVHNGWTASGGYGAEIAVGTVGDGVSSNDLVFLRSHDNRIWVWTQTSWSFTGGYLGSIVAGDNQVFGIGLDSQVWRYRVLGPDPGWRPSGGYGAQIVVANTGDTNPLNDLVFLRGVDNSMWLWDQTGWANLNQKLKTMVAGDYQVFGLDESGELKAFLARPSGGWRSSGFVGEKLTVGNAMDDFAADDIAFLIASDGAFKKWQ